MLVTQTPEKKKLQICQNLPILAEFQLLNSHTIGFSVLFSQCKLLSIMALGACMTCPLPAWSHVPSCSFTPMRSPWPAASCWSSQHIMLFLIFGPLCSCSLEDLFPWLDFLVTIRYLYFQALLFQRHSMVIISETGSLPTLFISQYTLWSLPPCPQAARVPGTL